MSKRSYVIFALILVATLFLVSCTRSAGPSTLPTQTSNATRAIGGDATSQSGLAVVEQYGTQTVLAAQGVTPGAAQATETPNPAMSGTPSSMTGIPPTGAAITAAATTQVSVPTSTPGRPATYTLQQGEHAYCLARRFNVNPQELLDLNGLTESQVLQPGVVLKIPQTGNSFPGTRALHSHPATYTVAVNDTIYKIACYYGDIDPTSIAAANSLTPPYALTVGRVLNIP